MVKLIEEGALPADTPGKRRRMVKLDDLLEYRARRREAQYRAMLESSTDYDEDLEAPRSPRMRFRRARAEVAAERRARAAKAQ